MIHLTANNKIFISIETADFHKGIDGLFAVCHLKLAKNQRYGTVFVFINRNKTMIRQLTYDGIKFLLMTKLLSTWNFQIWPQSSTPIDSMVAIQLRQLITDSGVSLTLIDKIKCLLIFYFIVSYCHQLFL